MIIINCSKCGVRIKFRDDEINPLIHDLSKCPLCKRPLNVIQPEVKKYIEIYKSYHKNRE